MFGFMKRSFSLRILVASTLAAGVLLYFTLQQFRTTRSDTVLFMPSGDVAELETSSIFGYQVGQKLINSLGQPYAPGDNHLAFLVQSAQPPQSILNINWGLHEDFNPEWRRQFG